VFGALKTVGHYAVSSLFQDYPERSELYSYFVEREYSKAIARGKSRLVVGRCRITSKITWESSDMEYAVVHPGDHNIRGGVREFKEDYSWQDVTRKMIHAFERDDLPAVTQTIDEYFGQPVFSLSSLFKDEQRRILNTLLKAVYDDLEELNRQTFERTAPLMQLMTGLGLPIPPSFRNTTTAVVHSQLLRAFQAEDFNPDHVEDLLEIADFWQVDLDKEELESSLRKRIEKLARELCDNPRDLPSLRNLAVAVLLTPRLPFSVNLYQAQNIYYELHRTEYPQLKAAAIGGDKNAQTWTEEFRNLGTKLSIRVD
jgi:hypothetical protein